MEYTLIAAENFQPKSWSGGTTTELFIFPPGASYLQRNFQFRLSTATVETDKSDFSILPGVSRKLMVLSGEITLHHEGHHSRHLSKFEIDEFEGDWKTSSLGKCTDFNLMTTGKTTGTLATVNVKVNQHIRHIIKSKGHWLFMYVYKGIVRIHLNDKVTTGNKGDLLVVHKLISDLDIEGIENSELILSEVI
ncbi:MAG TPA: HutD family protein [Cyclobacteriaceae bacterium]|jgi:environmental stress-induced protein Ves|nr:HutD family protein [Cyclobacteriaceae bacterium]